MHIEVLVETSWKAVTSKTELWG